jgi:hypothetical protein
MSVLSARARLFVACVATILQGCATSRAQARLGQHGAPNLARGACPKFSLAWAGANRVAEVGDWERAQLTRAASVAPRPRSSDTSGVLRFFDLQLLSFWFGSLRASDRVFALVARSGTGQPVGVLCAYSGEAFAHSIVLADSAGSGKLIHPNGVAWLVGRQTIARVGRVLAAFDSSVTDVTVAAVVDSLSKIEVMLGADTSRVVFGVFFDSPGRFSEAFPMGWSDDTYRDWTLLDPDRGAMFFVAQRDHGISTHELVHAASGQLALRVDARGSSIPYVANEALARSVGGSDGKSFAELVGKIDAADARDLIRAELDVGDISLARFVPGSSSLRSVDLLGAAYRVALSACRVFPADLLDARTAGSLRNVIRRIAAHLTISDDSAVELVAMQLIDPTSPLAVGFRRDTGSLLACR